jgi:hypothetical protein
MPFGANKVAKATITNDKYEMVTDNPLFYADGVASASG